MCSSKMDTLHIMGRFILSYATYLANLRICHILHHRHVFLSVYILADTCNANKLEKGRFFYQKYLWPDTRSSKFPKKHKMWIFNDFQWTRTRSRVFIISFFLCFFCFVSSISICQNIYRKKKHVHDAKYGLCANLPNM